jgi:SAM-dependent methyltransferase
MEASEWDERYAATELMWSPSPNQFVATECVDLPPGRAVDLAAGEGRNALWLAELGWEVTAVDFSQVALDKGHTRAPEVSVTWECADATKWRADAAYDLALIAYLHLPEPERAAANRNAFDALKPGGTFLLIGHDATNIAEGTGGPQYPEVLYSAKDVLTDLADRSFDVVRAERVERTVVDNHGHEHRTTGVALDCLVRLVRTS